MAFAAPLSSVLRLAATSYVASQALVVTRSVALSIRLKLQVPARGMWGRVSSTGREFLDAIV
jgi:hypothetical protein